MAEKKQSLRFFNNLAAFFISVYIASRLGINVTPSNGNQLSFRERSAVCFEIASWALFMTGLGWGQARREKDWLLRAATLLSVGSLAAQVLSLAPSRIQEVVTLGRSFQHTRDVGSMVQLAGGIAQFCVFAARSAAVGSATTYLASKRAAQLQKHQVLRKVGLDATR